MKSLLPFLIFLISWNWSIAKEGPILAVFAHPDDDITVGPLLTHYAKKGVDVYLAFVTSGQKGTAFTDIPAGDQLGKAREEEARAACKAYGIHPPLLLQEQDGTLATMQRRGEIMKKLQKIIEETKPQVVITWGPEGLTGHPDHQAVGLMVTEVFQHWKGAREKRPEKLYYVAFPSSKFTKPVPPFNESALTVDDEWITTIIDCRDGLEEAARAEHCYRTQHSAEIADQINAIMAKVLGGKVYLRRIFDAGNKPPKTESELFEK